jgi:DNA-binding MarR family transcriptional regulator
VRNTDISDDTATIKSRDNLPSYIFTCLRQIDADRATSATEFRLGYVLRQMLNKKTRACFPLQATLAKRLGVTDRTVRQCLSGLVERGHLRVRRRGRDQSAEYEFALQDRKLISGHHPNRPTQDRKFQVA